MLRYAHLAPPLFRRSRRVAPLRLQTASGVRGGSLAGLRLINGLAPGRGKPGAQDEAPLRSLRLARCRLPGQKTHARAHAAGAFAAQHHEC